MFFSVPCRVFWSGARSGAQICRTRCAHTSTEPTVVANRCQAISVGFFGTCAANYHGCSAETRVRIDGGEFIQPVGSICVIDPLCLNMICRVGVCYCGLRRELEQKRTTLPAECTFAPQINGKSKSMTPRSHDDMSRGDSIKIETKRVQ
jgi:hypothetical protein